MSQLGSCGAISTLVSPRVSKFEGLCLSLSISVLSEVTKEKVNAAGHAGPIFIGMIREAGLYDDIGQAYAALDPSRTIGVIDDKRVYSNFILLLSISTNDFMTTTPYPFSYKFLTKVYTRVVNEVQAVCRVSYDFTEHTALPSFTYTIEGIKIQQYMRIYKF
ncbi:hypothetical protein N7517_008663 [Penicillium concentricum]|uniref:GMP synthase C-terminal domain-containing protein n=1 Tax=Penicillium concentricum TaxID=293559 RepID=A0A9W9RT51_9EURO|nr:uncharacterized protein N7517_008663 [Penicillium concentricum]KAJ5365777.1 hypothetical protein N7517_008663 [Penicillium concentricum]